MNKAKNCIVHCIDFRFQKFIEKWIYENGYLDNSDLIAIAGASRDLVKPIEPTHKDNWIRELDTSIKLHDPEKIFVIEHQDCGGYALDETIKPGLSANEDRKQHKAWADKAKIEIEKLYPGKQVKIMYVDLEGHVNDY